MIDWYMVIIPTIIFAIAMWIWLKDPKQGKYKTEFKKIFYCDMGSHEVENGKCKICGKIV
jgi:hypothetical protein